MVLCDAVHRDPSTNKCTILGTFSTLRAREYPSPITFFVYYAVTDADGQVPLRLRLIDSKAIVDDTIDPVFELDWEAASPSPLAVLEGQVGLTGIIPAPGVYHCELLHGDQPLMSRRLVAIQIPNENDS